MLHLMQTQISAAPGSVQDLAPIVRATLDLGTIDWFELHEIYSGMSGVSLTYLEVLGGDDYKWRW